MSPQHISEIESGKRDPRLSSIERMAEAMGLTVLLVPETMVPEVRRYIATNGRTYTTQAGKTTAAPETNGPDHAPQEIAFRRKSSFTPANYDQFQIGRDIKA